MSTLSGELLTNEIWEYTEYFPLREEQTWAEWAWGRTVSRGPRCHMSRCYHCPPSRLLILFIWFFPGTFCFHECIWKYRSETSEQSRAADLRRQLPAQHVLEAEQLLGRVMGPVDRVEDVHLLRHLPQFGHGVTSQRVNVQGVPKKRLISV